MQGVTVPSENGASGTNDRADLPRAAEDLSDPLTAEPRRSANVLERLTGRAGERDRDA
jgi:hypothetical protein